MNEAEYAVATTDDEDNNIEESPLGVIASPALVLGFFITQMTAFFAFNVLQALAGIWPADLLFLMTAIYGTLLWYFAVRLINGGLLRRRHRPPSRWTQGWQKIMWFVSCVLIGIVAAYSIQMLRMLWTSGLVTPVQSVVVTVIGVEVMVFVLIAVTDQYSPIESRRLQSAVKALISQRRRQKRRKQAIRQ